MTTQSQRNRDADVFFVSQNAVIEAPSPPLPPHSCPPLEMSSIHQFNKQQPRNNDPTGIVN